MRAMSETRPPLSAYLAPRYWPMWLLLGVVRAATVLPYRLLMAVGRATGRIARLVLADRRAVAERNIDRCLVDLDSDERDRLVRAHFRSLGMALFETGLAWWASDARLARLCHLEGREHLEAALQQGKGVIMLSAHFTCLEICSRMLAMNVPLNPVYRGFKNPVLQEVMLRGRERASVSVIPKNDIRQMVRILRKKGIVWYAPDQSHSGKASEIVPLFGLPSQTNTATSRLARLTGAPVLPFLPWRRADGSGYSIVIGEALAGFPSGDDAADAALFHRLIEEQVARVPEQYLWIHRRFKNVPGAEDFYSPA